MSCKCVSIVIAVILALLGMSFGPVAFGVTTNKLGEVEKAQLACDYCGEYNTDKGIRISACCIDSNRVSSCMPYSYCATEKLHYRDNLITWRINGITGLAVDSVVLFCLLCYGIV